VLVTVEEHSLQGGFGSAVLELLAEAGLMVPVRTLGVRDALIEHGETAATVGIAAADIRDAVVALAARARAKTP
jgi:1-deoxy-D-xylulose-5-phosphate synthase